MAIANARSMSLGFWAFVAGCFAPCVDAAPQHAPIEFDLPVRCAPGDDCWIANYFDHDEGPGTRDFACGHMTYDGHDGTDFAIRDRLSMLAGVEVVAAAPGRVVHARDGLPDNSIGETLRASGKECGNGVLIDHGAGWSTQYCHLRQDSMRLRRGDHVERGTLIGLIGTSGKAAFPHLHLTVRYNGRPVDPFMGLSVGTECVGREPLWSPSVLKQLVYQPGKVFNVGFAAEPARWDAARAGDYRSVSLRRESSALTIWCEVLGTNPGDELEMSIWGPDWQLVAKRRETIVRGQATIFRMLGRARPTHGFAAGAYRAEITYTSITPSAVSQVRLEAVVD